MSNIEKEALIFNLKYSKMPQEPKSDRTPVFRNIHVSGVTVVGVQTPINIVGLEEAPVSDIVLRDIHIKDAKQPCVFRDCRNIKMDDVVVNGKEITDIE